MREETFSITTVEALMNSKMAILSENIGVADIIHDEDGVLLYKDNAPQKLASIIEWVVDNSEKIRELGKCARKIYEKYFTLGVFEKHVLDLLENHSVNETDSRA